MCIERVANGLTVNAGAWRYVQGDGSWDLLDSRCKRTLQDAGHQPNMWILPRGMKPYIALDKSKTSYFMTGPDGRALYNSALNGQNVNAVDIANNCQIFESKAFQMPEATEPLDLLWRERSCGEYYLMVNHLSGYPMTKYASNWRDIVVYNEKRDQFNPITLRAALEDCGRFEKDKSGPGYLIDMGDNNEDMFKFQGSNGWEICNFFGDMHADNLSAETKRLVAETVLGPVLAVHDDFFDVWKDGMRLIRELEDTDMDDEWYKYLTGTTQPNAKPAANDQDPATGFVRLPPVTMSSFFTSGLPKFVPSGFASWPGLVALAHASSMRMGTYHKRALKFTTVIRSLYDRMNQSLPNCVFLDEKFRSGYFVKPDGITTFFENLISVPRPNLWLNTSSGTQTDKFKIGPNTLPELVEFQPYPTNDDDWIPWFAASTLPNGKKDDKYQTFCERMRGLFDGSLAWTRIEFEQVLKQLVLVFHIIVKSSPDDGIKNALKFTGSLFKIIDDTTIPQMDRAQAFVSRVAYAVDQIRNDTSADKKNAVDAILKNTTKVGVKNVEGIPTANAPSSTTFLNQWVPTQLVASKRIVASLLSSPITIVATKSLLLPSARINGMVPPNALQHARNIVHETGEDTLASAYVQLFAARDGSDNQIPYAIHLTTHMNGREPDEPSHIGSKRRGGGLRGGLLRLWRASPHRR